MLSAFLWSRRGSYPVPFSLRITLLPAKLSCLPDLYYFTWSCVGCGCQRIVFSVFTSTVYLVGCLYFGTKNIITSIQFNHVLCAGHHYVISILLHYIYSVLQSPVMFGFGCLVLVMGLPSTQFS
jgi:hypothetical protein